MDISRRMRERMRKAQREAKRGDDTQEALKVRRSLFLDAGRLAEAEDLAWKRRGSVSEVMRAALAEYLDGHAGELAQARELKAAAEMDD